MGRKLIRQTFSFSFALGIGGTADGHGRDDVGREEERRKSG
jgi:hypothetical protein